MYFLNLATLMFFGIILFMTGGYGMPILDVTECNGTGALLAIDAGNILKDEVPQTILANVLLFKCVAVNKTASGNTRYIFNAGKVNVNTLGTECHDAPLFSVTEAEEIRALPLADMPFVCVEDTCVVYGAVDQTVLLSVALSKGEMEAIQAQKIEIPFVVTEVLFDFEGLLEQFARSLIDAYRHGITDLMHLRMNSFLGSAEMNCSRILSVDLRR